MVVINNVNVGSETMFKISSLDAGGNESPLSAAQGLFLFEDTFDGVTIDTTLWDITEPTPTSVEFTQNDELICTSKQLGTSPTQTNYLSGKTSFDISTMNSKF